jgi:hypothetical protein
MVRRLLSLQQVADGGHDFRGDAEVAEVIDDDQVRVAQDRVTPGRPADT